MPNHISIDTEIFLRIRAIILVGFIVFLFGTFGYMILEEWSFLDSLYMTAITLTTVGFGEVHTLDQLGQLFTIILLVFGLGGAGYALSNVTSIIVEGHLTNYFKIRKMEKRIEQLKSHIVLCGYGRVGRNVAQGLINAKKPFVIIEQEAEICDQLTEMGFLVVHGDSNDDETLLNAGIKNAYGLIAALDNDVNNLFVVMSARKINPDLFIVARVEQDNNKEKIIDAGANKVISPAHIGGYRMAATMLRPGVVNFLDVVVRQEGYDLSLAELIVQSNSPYAGKPIKNAEIPEKVKLIALKKSNGSYFLFPDSSTVLDVNDSLILLGENAALENLQSLTFQHNIINAQKNKPAEHKT